MRSIIGFTLSVAAALAVVHPHAARGDAFLDPFVDMYLNNRAGFDAWCKADPYNCQRAKRLIEVRKRQAEQLLNWGKKAVKKAVKWVKKTVRSFTGTPDGKDGRIPYREVAVYRAELKRKTKAKTGQWMTRFTLPKGAEVEVFRTSVKKFWGSTYCKVRYQGKEGWVPEYQLKVTMSAKAIDAVKEGKALSDQALRTSLTIPIRKYKTVVSELKGVGLRAWYQEPKTLGRLPFNTDVEVLARSAGKHEGRDWVKVRDVDTGQVGWMQIADLSRSPSAKQMERDADARAEHAKKRLAQLEAEQAARDLQRKLQGSLQVEESVGEKVKRYASNVGRAAKKAYKKVAKKVSDAWEAVKSWGKEKFMKYILPKLKWVWQKFIKGCGWLMDKAAQYNPLNILVGKQCSASFLKGFFCAIPEMIGNLAKLLGGVATAIWNNKVTCLVAGVATLGPGALICGLYYHLKPKVQKAWSCMKKLGAWGTTKLVMKMLYQQGCSFLGGLARDAVLALLSGGGSLPASITKWLNKLLGLVPKALKGFVKANAKRLQRAHTLASPTGALRALKKTKTLGKLRTVRNRGIARGKRLARGAAQRVLGKRYQRVAQAGRKARQSLSRRGEQIRTRAGKVLSTGRGWVAAAVSKAKEAVSSTLKSWGQWISKSRLGTVASTVAQRLRLGVENLAGRYHKWLSLRRLQRSEKLLERDFRRMMRKDVQRQRSSAAQAIRRLSRNVRSAASRALTTAWRYLYGQSSSLAKALRGLVARLKRQKTGPWQGPDRYKTKTIGGYAGRPEQVVRVERATWGTGRELKATPGERVSTSGTWRIQDGRPVHRLSRKRTGEIPKKATVDGKYKKKYHATRWHQPKDDGATQGKLTGAQARWRGAAEKVNPQDQARQDQVRNEAVGLLTQEVNKVCK